MVDNEDQTIPFLPTRLNRESTVFGGMSMSEFTMAAILGFIVGAGLGLFFSLMFGIGDFWPLIPSLAMFLCLLFIVIGKSLFARLKRGKPEAYLNRLIEVKLDGLFGGNQFIFRQGTWSIRRVKKQIK